MKRRGQRGLELKVPESPEEFDFDAYYRDTRRLSIDARGAWMDCLYQMRLESPRGRISEPVTVYATMFGCDRKKAQRVIAEITERRVADHVVEGNGHITLINRRMFREWQSEESERVATNERQRRRRGTQIPTSVTETNGNKDGPQNDVSRFGHGNVTKSGQNASSSVEEINLNTSSQQKKTKRLVDSSRIPDPFPITSEMTEWAKVNVADLRLADAHDRFVEYWTNSTQAKAWKVNWVLAWQKGMKLAMKWQSENDARLTAGKSVEALPMYNCPDCHDLGERVVVNSDNTGYTRERCRCREAIAA
jgi:hypothetical protein